MLGQFRFLSCGGSQSTQSSIVLLLIENVGNYDSLLLHCGRGGGGRVDQWEVSNWLCDHRVNERPRKKSHGKGKNRQTDTQTDRHTDSVTTRPTRPRGSSWWKINLTTPKLKTTYTIHLLNGLYWILIP